MTDDLANEVEWVLQAKDREALSKSAKDKVVDNFDSQVIANQYVSLYRSILNSP